MPILWLVLGAIVLIANPGSIHAQTVVDTYPWAGIQSETIDGGEHLMQPIGLTPIASGTSISKIRLLANPLEITTNDGARMYLRQYEHSDYSGSTLQQCEFRLEEYSGFGPPTATTHSGFVTIYNALAPCIINGEGWYALYIGSVFGNVNESRFEGNTVPFRGEPPLVHVANNTAAYSTGTADANIQAVWFQIFDSSTSTQAIFVFDSLSTTTNNTTLNDLLADVSTDTGCVNADSTLGYAFCYVLTFLFTPRPETIADFRYLLDPYENKPPFAYFGAISDAFEAFSTTTTPYYAFPLVASAATFFTPFSTGLAVILWVLFGVWLLYRITTFDFHQ